jgi:aldose 1-epimerase
MKIKISALLIAAAVMFGCKQHASLSVSQQPFGQVDGKAVSLYTLTNANGMVVKITNYGGIVTSLSVADKAGKFEDVVLGFDSLKNYLEKEPYFGALIGRYGNRILKGKFTLDGTEYTLATNDGANTLHGGVKGFDKVVWDAKEIKGTDSVGLDLTYVSKDMEEGYPGTLTTNVKYILNNKNELKLYYEATTDKATVLNLTHHTYFNLSGAKEDVLNHELTLVADSITPVDSTLIPTGKIDAVAGTAFDFIQAHKIGERIANVKGGYDHNFKLSRKGADLELAAVLYDATSGRVMETYTTEPGIQFYSGNFLDGTLTGKGNIVYKQHFGLCLETQHFPDSPNKPNFPSTVLKPGEKYTQVTVYKFSVK